jgi:hypothetical protein
MEKGSADNTPEHPEVELIRRTERERLRALVDVDLEVAWRLHAEGFQLVTPGGAAYSREEYLGDIASGDVDYLVWEPTSEIEVHVYGDGAVIRYRAHIEIVVRGEKDVLNTWHTDSYEKRDGQWQVLWSQATRIR